MVIGAKRFLMNYIEGKKNSSKEQYRQAPRKTKSAIFSNRLPFRGDRMDRKDKRQLNMKRNIATM
jgi:hypothetical protein